MVLVGRSADRRNEQRWHLAVASTIGSLGLMLSVQRPAMALGGLSPRLSAYSLFRQYSGAYRWSGAAAAAIAMINSFGNLACFASPYFVTWI